MLLKKTVSITLFFLSVFSFSQNSTKKIDVKYPSLYKTIPVLNNAEPEWVQMLYSNELNYFKLELAFRAYYKENTFEKNTHTQNFKHLSKIVNEQDYLLEDGTVYIPNLKENNEIIQRIAQSRKTSSNKLSQKGLVWEPVGPIETYDVSTFLKSSRQLNITSMDISRSNPQIIYAGGASGGLFKTTDKGLNWTSVGDDVVDVGDIMEVQIDPNNSDVVYVGSRNKFMKSIDGGLSWSVLINENRIEVLASVINPNNSQIIHVASSKGLRRSNDGGNTWNTIIQEKCWDVRLKTDDPNTIFVAKSNPAKNTTEIVKSTNGGLSFTVKNSGWFNPIGGVAARESGAKITVTNADPNRLYVVLIGEENDNVDDKNYIGIYRSDNAGESWTTPYDGNGDGQPDNEPGGPYSSNHWSFSTTGRTGGSFDQGFYNLDIEASDSNPNYFMVGLLNLFKSEDGGKTFTPWGGYECIGCGIETRHPDIQDIQINGDDVFVCSDGGIDLYDKDFNFVEARNKGLNGSEYWGFDQGWNEDVLVGGRYHNGNGAYIDTYNDGKFIALGGAESPTGYVNKGENRRVSHSDISGWEITDTWGGSNSRRIAKFTLFSNESYVLANRGEIVSDPRYWNTLILGKDNKLWKSKDEGQTFDLMYEFGTDPLQLVKEIEVSRTDPNIMFVTQTVGGSGKLFRSIDAGQTWNELTFPAFAYTAFISMNIENELFIGLHNTANNANKVFKSIDLGDTWTNLSSAVLNGEKIDGIHVQEGTNGGVYLYSPRMIFYKNNDLNDWQIFSEALPLHFRINRILPFYRDNKIRVAGNKGIWERDLFETSKPKAQPMTAYSKVDCIFDPIQFEDYSILNHDGASWLWEFPGASTVSSNTIRNPIVSYPGVGNYTVKLTITDKLGNTDTKEIPLMIEVGIDCEGSITDADQDGISDFEESTVCFNSIEQTALIDGGNTQVITDFNGIDFGTYFTTVNIYNECYSTTATLKARVDLNTNIISVFSYTHFNSTNVSDPFTGFQTNEIISTSSDYAKIGFRIDSSSGSKKLIFDHVSNACGQKVRIDASCWSPLDADYDGVLNYLDTDSDADGITDTDEVIVCNDQIPGGTQIAQGNTQLVTNFGGVTSGSFFLTLNVNTNCYNALATLRTRVNLDLNTFTILSYSHFASNVDTDPMIGNGTDEVVSGLNTYAKIGYRIEDVAGQKRLVFNHITNACGGNANSRLLQSCFSPLDRDDSGIPDYLDYQGSILSNQDITNPTINNKVIPYPNPSSNGSVINFTNLKEDYIFTLYTIEAKLVKKQNITANETFKMGNVSPGMYLYRIETKNKIINGKLIVN